MADVYSIESNDTYGRYLVATKELSQGELILRETPTLVGSQICATHICFKCGTILSTSIKICKKCKTATVCPMECTGSNHSQLECESLQTVGVKVTDILNNPQIVMPLRCLLIQKYNAELWNEILKLESHIHERKGSGIWKMYEVDIEKVLCNLKILTKKDVKGDMLLQKICGILDVNTFEIRSPSSEKFLENSTNSLRGLYLKASLMAHDCVGNTHISVDDNFTMTIRASYHISIGDIIFFNYSNCLKGTNDRRLHLKAGKYFDCVCKRCSDPTELGTFLSSIKCTKCKIGLVSPADSLKDMYSTPWICNSCNANQRGQMVKSILEIATEKTVNLDVTDIINAENLLKSLSMILSDNHYLILNLKQSMIPLCEQNIYNDWAMRRKIEMCTDVIQVLKVLEPGISRHQGIALYQLHSTQVNLANKLYQSKQLVPENYLASLADAEKNLTCAIKHLLYEPKNSPEGRLFQHSLQDLKILRNTMAQLQSK